MHKSKIRRNVGSWKLEPYYDEVEAVVVGTGKATDKTEAVVVEEVSAG